jgi:hypothetical protein
MPDFAEMQAQLVGILQQSLPSACRFSLSALFQSGQKPARGGAIIPSL